MDDNFAKGIEMLLKNAYHAPVPNEGFRARLLSNLQARQRQVVNRARRHHLYYFAGGLLSAAAVLVFAFLPMLSDTATTTTITPTATNTTTALAENPLANSANLIGATAIALQPLDIKLFNEQNWTTISLEEKFALTVGLQIRTPVGMLENAGFGIIGGPAVMLVGMSNLEIGKCGSLKVLDGQAMVDLSRTNHAYNISLNNQQFALQPGAMILLSVDHNIDYAVGGAPAPVLAILHGNANLLGNNARELTAGRVYELYDTGTGIFPSRNLSYSENQRRFMPMIDAIRAANVQSW